MLSVDVCFSLRFPVQVLSDNLFECRPVSWAHLVVDEDNDAGVARVGDEGERPGHVEDVRLPAEQAEFWDTGGNDGEGHGRHVAQDQQRGHEYDHRHRFLVPHSHRLVLSVPVGGFAPPFWFFFKFNDEDGRENSQGDERHYG